MKEMIGKTFGKLKVLSRAEDRVNKNGKPVTMWICECECGNLHIASTHSLVYGTTKSCGCYSKEIHAKQKGLTKHPLYNIWRGMKKRCYNPNDQAYHNYGARGIHVCEEWKENFLSFYDWAMSHGFEPGLSIERIDNDGNYEPSNCKWATSKEQGNNTRQNHFLEYNGKTLTLAQWQEETGIRQQTIRWRIKKGWSVEKALTTPTR